jgi:hypothetical protein
MKSFDGTALEVAKKHGCSAEIVDFLEKAQRKLSQSSCPSDLKKER